MSDYHEYENNIIHISGKDIVDTTEAIKRKMNYREPNHRTCSTCTSCVVERDEFPNELYTCSLNPVIPFEVDPSYICDYYKRQED